MKLLPTCCLGEAVVLEVRLLGQFDIRRDGRVVHLPLRPAQSLFAYLLLHPGTPHRREKLAGLIWPDLPESSVREELGLQTLRQLDVAALRAAIDVTLIHRKSAVLSPACRRLVETLCAGSGEARRTVKAAQRR